MTQKTPVKIILGTHTIGDSVQNSGICHFDTPEEVQGLLDTFYNRGYRNIDTSRLYPGSEERLGKCHAASRFLIHTKVQSGTPGDHEPEKLQLSIQKSLEDLKTSSVQTMFLHVPDRQTPFEDIAKTMNEAIQQGKFKDFGLSNYSAAEVQKFIDICEQNGYAKPAVYQGHYNAIVRSGEKELFPLLRKHNIAFFAYSPAAGGFFSKNSSSSSARWSDTNVIGKIYSSLYSHSSVRDLVAHVQDLGKKYDVDSHDVVLRWTAFHSILDGKYGDGVIFAVSKMEQLHKTMDALEAGALPVELADAISAVYDAIKGNEPPYHL